MAVYVDDSATAVGINTNKPSAATSLTVAGAISASGDMSASGFHLPDNGKITIQARKIHTELSSGKIGADTKKFWSMVQETDTNIEEKDFYDYPKTRKAADVHSKLAATYVCHAIMKANIKNRNQFAK